MNQQIKRSEADVIRDGLDTFLSVIAERDRLLNENALLHQEVELKRARIADAERELDATKRELATATTQNTRLQKLLERFVEFLGGAQSILSEAIADAAPLVPGEEPQTMRSAIVADIRDHMAGVEIEPAERQRFAEIWGGRAMGHEEAGNE